MYTHSTYLEHIMPDTIFARRILLLTLALTLQSFSTLANETGKHIIRVDVADRLLRPWDMAFLNENEALVTEKEGTLQRVNLTTGAKSVIGGLPTDLDSRNKTGVGDNTGLFAVKLDPDFALIPWVYLSYAATNHDGEGSTTKVIRAQNMMDKRGKIYRLNADGTIPTDNPEFDQSSVPGLYASGIRAAQGMTLHPVTKQIWFSEHGTRQGDELNLLKAGANYGWPIITTGGYRYQKYQPPQLKDRVFTSPIWFWQHTVAPTGLTFYRGDEFPHWSGDLLVAGLSRGSFWRISFVSNKISAVQELFINERVRLRNIKQGPDGRLYVLTDEANGRILRLQSTSKAP